MGVAHRRALRELQEEHERELRELEEEKDRLMQMEMRSAEQGKAVAALPVFYRLSARAML